MKEICPICGSKEIVCLDKSAKKYRCKSCDETFVLEEKPAPKSSLSAAEIYKKHVGSIIEITSYFSDTDCRGTAFYVSDNGYLITNLHIVVTTNSYGKPELCKECYGNGKNHDDIVELKVVYLDKNNDLALLKAMGIKSQGLKLANHVPEIGEPVVAIGNARGTGLSVVNGIIGDTDRDFGGKPAFLFNALVAAGCSGGPIFNDKGEVCGVTVGGYKEAEGMKYGIPVEVLHAFLKDAEREKSIRIN